MILEVCGPGAMAQSVKCLLHKHEDWSLILSTQGTLGTAAYACKSSVREADPGRPLKLCNHSQPTPVLSPGSVRSLSQRIRWLVTEKDAQCPPLHTLPTLTGCAALGRLSATVMTLSPRMRRNLINATDCKIKFKNANASCTHSSTGREAGWSPTGVPD